MTIHFHNWVNWNELPVFSVGHHVVSGLSLRVWCGVCTSLQTVAPYHTKSQIIVWFHQKLTKKNDQSSWFTNNIFSTLYHLKRLDFLTDIFLDQKLGESFRVQKKDQDSTALVERASVLLAAIYENRASSTFDLTNGAGFVLSCKGGVFATSWQLTST